MEWIGALPGKRENIRYVGDHILVQKDIEAQGKFDDIVAYGGWPFDDHSPKAFYDKGAPTTFHNTPNPFGIPFRALYSKNIENLYFAGRNISMTHAAMSSARVMATCALLGEAVGEAANVAREFGLTPQGVYDEKLDLLQQPLARSLFLQAPVRHNRLPGCDRPGAVSAASDWYMLTQSHRTL